MLQEGDLVKQHYRVRSVIGRGGMSIVYLVHDEVLDVERALKELSAFHATDPEWRDRFRNEARLAASLGDHPAIVPIIDYFVWDDVPYIVMPYFALGTVKALVPAELSFEQIVGVIATVLEGVAEAESRGIIHRDLKPDNLLRTDQGSVKITDFGIATTWELSMEHHTRSGYVMGNELYIAPERLLGEEATIRSDLYSVGVIAYELFRGRPPFTGSGSVREVAARKVRENALPIRRVVPALPIGIADWVDRMLARQPRKRPSDAQASLRALDQAADSAFGSAWRRRSLLPQKPRPAVNKVRPITSQLIGITELKRIVDPWRHAFRVATSPATILLTGFLIVAAEARGDRWLYVVAGVAFATMSALRFFDLEVAYASRGVHQGPIRRILRRLAAEPPG